MQSIQDLLITANHQLEQAFATQEVASHFEAELLLAHILQQPRSYLRAHSEQEVTPAHAQQFAELIKRRSRGEPIAYILGKQEFWSLEFTVTRDTLIPRPDTELLVETTLELLPKEEKITIADLGTGSGAIAIALAHERPQWQFYAIDESEEALQIAQMNAEKHKATNITFAHGHWCAALPKDLLFDVIVSNPPYIAEDEWSQYVAGLQYEPKSALTSGQDGLNAIREIIREAKAHLKSGGYLILEHGYNQGPGVCQLLKSAKYAKIYTIPDLSSKERITLGRYF